MRRKKGKRYSKKIKAEVQDMLREPGYSVMEISQAYGMSRSTIHKWKADMNREEPRSAAPHFAEVKVIGSTRKLSKASMSFDNLSVSFEGKISTSDLVSVIKILEAS